MTFLPSRRCTLVDLGFLVVVLTHPTHPTHPTYPTYPTHPTHPTYPTYPTHPTYPTYPTHPTHPTYPTYPTHPTYPTYPTYPTPPTTRFLLPIVLSWWQLQPSSGLSVHGSGSKGTQNGYLARRYSGRILVPGIQANQRLVLFRHVAVAQK